MLLVAYDGSGYRGFAVQPGLPTVGGRLTDALARVAGHPVALTCAGRTDAGVHAAGQVVHADVAADAGDPRLQSPGWDLARSLTRLVGPAIAVLDACEAPTGFDARRSAVGRWYRYLILRSVSPDPLLRNRAWHVPADLDLSAMRIAADALLGEHDFSAFCKRPPDPSASLVRRVKRVQVSASFDAADPRLWSVDVEANAFCHQMVRSLVGALVSVGEGKLTAAALLEILRAGERTGASRLAPPGGLCLMGVSYPEEMVPGGTWMAPA